jgi:2-haloacid dehalogenase/putative hydrolase of the HAD superfamily
MSGYAYAFLDVYGTLVHEDDLVIAEICRQLAEHSGGAVAANAIARHWWQSFVPLCAAASGDAFQTQRILARSSLEQTISHFGLDCAVDPLIERQYAHWRTPPIFDDTRPFLERLRASGIAICLVSNIDGDELDAALAHHGLVFDYVITSERSRSYKPRPEMFEDALALVGAAPETVLHIGDSFSNDVRGAAAADIPVAWLNRTGKPTPDNCHPTAIIRDLRESLPFFENR